MKKAEQQNEERRWAEEAEKVKVAKVAAVEKENVVPPTAVESSTRSPGASVDVKGKGRAVGAVDESVDSKPSPAVPLDEEEEEEEEEEFGATHGMFAGAGKFLLAGGLAGAGKPACSERRRASTDVTLPQFHAQPLLPSTVLRSTSSPPLRLIHLPTPRPALLARAQRSSRLAATLAAFPLLSALC